MGAKRRRKEVWKNVGVVAGTCSLRGKAPRSSWSSGSCQHDLNFRQLYVICVDAESIATGLKDADEDCVELEGVLTVARVVRSIIIGTAWQLVYLLRSRLQMSRGSP